MKALGVVFRLGLLIGLGIEILGSPTSAQTPSAEDVPSPASGLRKLTGADAKKAEELDKAIEAARKADRWDDAMARSDELVALRSRVQGPKHFETVNREWLLKGVRRIASMSREDRAAYRSADSMHVQAQTLHAQGNCATAQPLFEKVLEINRRLLTDEHPDTVHHYNNLPFNLNAQGQYPQAQPLFEKALKIYREMLGDEHPNTAAAYSHLAYNLNTEGKYAAAQPLFEKALEIRRRVLTDDHPNTGTSFGNVAANLNAQGKYLEARDQWPQAVKSLDKVRLRVAFTGLERAGGTEDSPRPSLAAVLARLGQPAEAWRSLEEDLGRGLLDELAARRGQRLAPAERARLGELTAALERLDKLVEATPKGLDQAERAKTFEDLKHERDLASIALGEFQTKLVQDYKELAGEVATLDKIQAVLPADAALVAWVDIPPAGPNAADPDGEHWGVVVRARGIPAWIPIAGTGADGLWTKDDSGLADRARSELRRRPGASSANLRSLVDRLRTQRLEPLTKAKGAPPDGLPPARKLIVLPSRAMAGIPIEALLVDDDTRTVSYAPSATVFKYLLEQTRPDRHAGLLALGDPVYERPDASSEPKPLPDHGLLVNLVAPGSNAATHGLKSGDVLLAYNGVTLRNFRDLKVVTESDQPIVVEIWREGRSSRLDLAPGKLGAVIDPRPAPEAIAANRAMNKVLVAARSGDEDLAPLPGTRYEVEAIARLFAAADRPTRILLEADASEPGLDRLAASGELGRFAFIHLATHGVIDEGIPTNSAVILTQTGLPDPLEQALSHKPVFDGRLLVREIQRGCDLKAELVTLSACETALGRDAGGEGFVGFTQALLMSGARSVCLSLWKVDDKATSFLMTRFYQNLLGKRAGLAQPIPKAEALQEAKRWLRSLTVGQVDGELAGLERGGVRPLAKDSGAHPGEVATSPKPTGIRPYDQPYFWAAFVLAGDPD
jgi:tetratricopeptide (TPR) repeat protein